MKYNYSKLIGRIAEKCGTRTEFAKQMGLSERSIFLKLTGKTGFKQSEIVKACSVLCIKPEDIPSYFFRNV